MKNLRPIQYKNSRIKCQLNHIKQIFQNNFPQSTDIVLTYNLVIPSIWITHIANGQKQQTHIRQFLLTKKQAKNPEIIDRVYSQLYTRVSNDYSNMIIFGIEKAKKLKKESLFTLKSFSKMHRSNNNKLMFYCIESKQKDYQCYGFSLFNKDLCNVQFDSNFIRQLRNDLFEQYELYLDFLQDFFPIKDTGKPKVPIKPIKQKQETVQKQDKKKYVQRIVQKKSQKPKYIEKQKNPQKPKYVQKNKDIQKEDYIKNIPSKEDIDKRLNKILSKDLTSYDKKLKSMNQQFNQMQQQYSHGKYIQIEELDNFEQEINEFQKRLENFELARKQIKKMRDNNKSLKGCFKKAIIAEKQLDSKLPIIARKQKIMKVLQDNDVIILQGETGSGKSTQLPQFLCQFFDLFEDERALPVLITQPRKLAAKTLAQRVAFELQEKVGDFVECIDSDLKSESRNAKIIFKLDRIALDDLIQDQGLKNYSCLVLDQAHERTMNIDVIIGLINKIFKKAHKNFKVIVTSASMDIKLFQDYFHQYGTNIHITTIKVPGRMYPVSIQYKDYNNIFDSTKKIEKVIDEEIIPYPDEMKRQLEGNVLIFCTNVNQISQLVEKYTQKLDPKIFKVFPLHGKLSPEEQSQIFKKIKQFKLIFASRMAETAITIDGVTVVVDPGEDMKKMYDQQKKISNMRLMSISQSTAKQRAGRAGRTSKGHCFRLYSQKGLQKFPPNQTPQIQNESLEIVVLRLKQLKLKNLSKFQFLSPPSPEALNTSEELLKMIGCLDYQNELNSIGRLLVKIPIEPFLSRAIAESLIYESILRDKYAMKELLGHFKGQQIDKIRSQPLSSTVIEILCMIVNSDNLFYSPQGKREDTDLVKFKEFSQESGDFFYLKNIFNKFRSIYEQTNSQYKIKKFLNDYYLSYKILKEVRTLNKQIGSIIKKQGQINLRFIGDETLQKCRKKISKCSKYEELVLSCLLSSFCTNLCLYSHHPQIGYTLLCQKIPIRLYGTSNLQLQGIYPKWIVCHNLMQNASGQVYCKIAHQVKEQYFQKQLIQGYAIQKYDVYRLIKQNPFYIRKEYSVSTYIYQKVFQAYSTRKQFAYFHQFSQQIQILFSENHSKLTLFIYNDGLKQQNQLKIFQQFLQTLERKMGDLQKYNYLGNCKILFDQQYQIHQIQFMYQEYVLDITNLDRNLFNLIYNNCYGYGKLQPISQDHIRIYLDQQAIAKSLRNYLQQYKQYGRFHTKVIELTKNHNDPHQEILIYFFAGSPSFYKQEVVFLGGYNQDSIYQNIQFLRQAIKLTKNERGYHYDIYQQIKSIGVSSNKNYIKIQTLLDEFNMQQILHYLVNKRYIHKRFIFPHNFYKERSPDYPQSTFSNQEWKRSIHKCISRYIQQDDCIITISSTNHSLKYSQDNERINLCAKITTQDKRLYQNLYKRMNDQLGILGMDKVHIRLKYHLFVCSVSSKIYNYYYNRCSDILFQNKEKGIFFEFIVQKKFKAKQEQYSIYITSHHKKNLFGPLEELKKLFTPKSIKLTKLQSQIIKHNYSTIINQIKSNAEVQFSFDNKVKTIYAFCDDNQIKLVENELRKLLAQRNLKSVFVSYKGRNLNNVLKILERFQKEYQKDQFFYQIAFMKWGLFLNGKLQIIQQCNLKIKQLTEEQEMPCQICQDNIITPFKLHNCQHVFCWACLVRAIRQCKLDNDQQMVCPYSSKMVQCKAKINYYDVKVLFNDQEFRQICDMKARQFAKKSNKHLICQNCHQIFQRNSSSRLDCTFCGSKQSLQV